jgi:hypothetical protein
MILKYLCLLLLAIPGLLLGVDAIGNGTVAGLPAFGENTDSITAIKDGADTSDCTVGGGATYVVCRDTGAAWVKAFPGGDFVDITPGSSQAYLEGRLFYDEDADAMAYYTFTEDVTLQIGQELWVRIKNETGIEITDGQAVYIDGAVGVSSVPTVDLAQADAEATVKQVGVATHNIAEQAFGFVTVTGIVRGVDTDGLGEGSLLYVSATEAGALVNVAPSSPNWRAPVAYVISDHQQNGSIFVFRETAHLGAGETTEYFRGDESWQTLDGAAVANTPAGNIEASTTQDAIDELDTEKKDEAEFDAHALLLDGLTDGVAVDPVLVTIVNTAGTLYAEVELPGSGDVRFIFNSTIHTLDCTTGAGTGGKARIALTAGADVNNPVKNYVRVIDNGADAILEAATSKSSGEHANVATVTVADTVTFDSVGPYQFQRFTESLVRNDLGMHHWARDKIRSEHASWISGAAPTLQITVNGGSADNVHLDTSAGVIKQLHDQTWPAQDDGPYYFGNGTTPYAQLTDLNGTLFESDGSAISNATYSLVIWGAMNATGGDSKVYVNLPSGVYAGASNAINDRDNFADYNVPAAFRGVGFMIARVVLSHSPANSGTWTEEAVIDLRGAQPGTLGGGATPTVAATFADSQFQVFNNDDPTKVATFDVSGVTAGEVSDLAVPDADGTIALQSAISETCAAGVASMTVTLGIVTALTCN